MADDNEKKCKNPACSCPPQPDGKYCSASCEGTGDTIEIDCDCGHPECTGNFCLVVSGGKVLSHLSVMCR